MKHISILGSTGSIGTQTLDIVSKNDDLNVVALAAYGNIELLEKQVREYKPSIVCVYDENKALELRVNIQDLDIKVVSGMDGLIEAAVIEQADIVVYDPKVSAFLRYIGQERFCDLDALTDEILQDMIDRCVAQPVLPEAVKRLRATEQKNVDIARKLLQT